MTANNFHNILESGRLEASAPCRIDMGGTLDISTFYLPLRHLFPCTLNIAIDLRTRVRLLPYSKGTVKVSSRGFRSAQFFLEKVRFDHPLGLMFAIAAYFKAEGVHISIESASPPRGALGGSSAAAVALIAAFLKADEQGSRLSSRKSIATLAHAIESSVAGAPCGLQDQLAAAYGGVNAWFWKGEIDRQSFRKKTVIPGSGHRDLEKHLLLAYCGIPHESRDINGKWMRRFLTGRDRGLWSEIVLSTRAFCDALSNRNFELAAAAMNRETAIRRRMTPDVLDEIGKKLVRSAVGNNCGARFTGAGGGGCIWALGESENIARLRGVWAGILSKRKSACLLDTRINSRGVK